MVEMIESRVTDTGQQHQYGKQKPLEDCSVGGLLSARVYRKANLSLHEYKALYTCMRLCVRTDPLRVCVLQLELLGHLQQGIDGGILVSPLRVQNRTDHFLVEVGEHVL